MPRSQVRSVGLWLAAVSILLAGLFAGCSPKTTPPGASSIGGSVDGMAYSYHYWEEGLAVLIWHNFSYGGEGCSGTGSTEDPVYRLECSVESQDGRRFDWVVHTQDGVTAQVWIDGQSYDLDQGALFLVSAQPGETQVEQVQRDLSALTPTNEALEALVTTDSDIAGFYERYRQP